MDHPAVTGGRQLLLIGGLGGVAIWVLGAWAAGPRPTGSPAIDFVLLVVVLAGVAWVAAPVSWWVALLPALAAVVLSTIADGGIGVRSAAAWLVMVVALVLAARGVGDQRATAALVVAGCLTLSSVGQVGGFGVSSAVGIGCVLVVLVAGLRGRPPSERRRVYWVLAATFGLAVVATAGLAAAAVDARSDISAGNAAAREGLRLLRNGDFDGAQRQFDDAAARFQAADDAFAKPWAQLARGVPVIAQHRTAAASVTTEVVAASRSVGDQLGALSTDDLRLVDGRIDLTALDDARASLVEVQASLQQLHRAVTDADDGWLFPPVRSRLLQLDDELATQERVGATSLEALRIAPAMLGGDGPRRYLVLFTTPAEARGGGGYAGNYAELTFDNGAIALSDFGRTQSLSEGGQRPRMVTGPADWLARYGPFGFAKGPNGEVGEVPWSNLTLSPAFPSTAQVAAELYPQSGGRPVDGVLMMDVYALAELVDLVGPIRVPDSDRTISGADAAQFLLVDQYFQTDYAQRIDMLEVVAQTTMQRLTSGQGPDLLALARQFAPLVGQRRVVVWSASPEEQAVLHESGADGALLPDLDGRLGLAFTANNAAGSKIDTFLERTIDVDVGIDAAGTVSGSVSIRLRNGAPASGYPDFIIGNAIQREFGLNRTYLTLFSSVPVFAAELDGEPIGLHPGEEGGLYTYSLYIDIASESSVELILHLGGEVSQPGLVVQPQPLVAPEQWLVELTTPGRVCRLERVVDQRTVVGCDG